MTMVTLAAAQIGAELENVEKNVAKVVETIAQAKEAGADLVVFPETILNGYLFEDEPSVRASALKLDGPELGAVVAAVQEAGILAVVGLLEDAGEHVYNTVALIG